MFLFLHRQFKTPPPSPSNSVVQRRPLTTPSPSHPPTDAFDTSQRKSCLRRRARGSPMTTLGVSPTRTPSTWTPGATTTVRHPHPCVALPPSKTSSPPRRVHYYCCRLILSSSWGALLLLSSHPLFLMGCIVIIITVVSSSPPRGVHYFYYCRLSSTFIFRGTKTVLGRLPFSRACRFRISGGLGAV